MEYNWFSCIGEVIALRVNHLNTFGTFCLECVVIAYPVRKFILLNFDHIRFASVTTAEERCLFFSQLLQHKQQQLVVIAAIGQVLRECLFRKQNVQWGRVIFNWWQQNNCCVLFTTYSAKQPSLQPITNIARADNQMNQWDIETNTCSPRQGRENIQATASSRLVWI